MIDAHVHVYPPEVIARAEEIAEREPYFAALTAGRAHRWATVEDLLAAMDEDGVDESWICGFGFMDIGLCRLCNDYVLEAAMLSGGRLKAMAVVPPLGRGMEAELRRCAEAGAIGAGEIFPDGQSFDITNIRETWRFAGVCDETGLFALVHTAEPVGRTYAGKGTVGPREAYQLAENHPELRILFAHWGGGLFLYETMPDAASVLENVWYDTAAAPFLYGAEIFTSALLAGAGRKIVYGSDYPLLRWPRYRKPISQTPLVDMDLDALLCANARRLLTAG